MVLKFPTNHWNPEGVRFTVAVPLVYPAAVAVSCALPLLAKLCIEKLETEKLPCVRAKLMDWLNGPAGLVARSTAAELLVSVSVLSVGGAAAKPMD